MSEQNNRQWIEQRTGHWLTESWSGALVESLSALATGEGLSLEAGEPSPQAWREWSEPFWFETGTDLAEGAAIHAGCARATGAALVGLLTGSEDVDEELLEDTFRELLNQSFSAVASAAPARIGREVTFSEPNSAEPPEGAAAGVEFRFELDGVVHLLALVPNPAALEGLFAVSADADDSAALPEGEAGASDAAPMASALDTADRGTADEVQLSESAKQNLRMLLDVELDLAISFGSTELALREVLKLASGSIVELNRSVSDPVDVLVNDRIVARGEVVVVDGNYGIRISEIVSRQERIRTIF